MAFKTITIKESVYRELLKAKGEESFSEFFEKLVKGRKPDLKKFYGAWKMSSAEWKRVKGMLRKRRSLDDKDYRKRLERLFE